MATQYPDAWWMTLAQICFDLQVDAAEYLDWASRSEAPVPEFGADGIGRVHRADFEAWTDSLPTVDLLDLIDTDDPDTTTPATERKHEGDGG
jgi:hypothetical protein